MPQVPPAPDPDTVTAPPARRRGPLRTLLAGCLWGLLLALGVEAGRVLVGNNLHAVLPGRVYRCAQQSGPGLQRLLRATGARTVVNLRGCCANFDWYLDECRATSALGVSQEDVCLSAARLPSAHEIRQLVEVLERSEYPLLLHCRRGADRTGLAAAVVLLLQTDAGLDEALRQLGPRYGHVAVSRTANLDRFFDLYREWLAARGEPHSRAAFRRWLVDEYCPGECRCRFEVLEAPPWVPLGRSSALRLRVHNTSVKPWRFRPGTRAGIHLYFQVVNLAFQQVAEGKAGLFEAEVPPGASIDLTVALPPLPAPGTYLVNLYMVNDQHCAFFQTGQDPFLCGVEVRDQPPLLPAALERR